jgi:hypothetical protein
LNLTRVERPDKSGAEFGYDEAKDWLTSFRAGSLEYTFKYGEDSPTRFHTTRTDADGNVTRWDFDERARTAVVTSVQYLDGKIEPLKDPPQPLASGAAP